MTKDAYFEMCEMLGEEPLEEEIPVEVGDFPELIQQCFLIYHLLPDTLDTMGGNFLGKNYSIVFNLFSVYNFEDTEIPIALDILQYMDSIRAKIISDKIKAESPVTKK